MEQSVTALLLTEQSEARAATMWLGFDPDERRTGARGVWGSDSGPNHDASTAIPRGWVRLGGTTSLWRQPFASSACSPIEVRGPRSYSRSAGAAAVAGLTTAIRPRGLEGEIFSPGSTPSRLVPLPRATVAGKQTPPRKAAPPKKASK
ncbi:hypothetical protein ABI59_12160 [Acidobacteria bacterium Mor1]|nr:hypothetical protein ABI59_12160 [Acidobacteria bacterium Mor1]